MKQLLITLVCLSILLLLSTIIYNGFTGMNIKTVSTTQKEVEPKINVILKHDWKIIRSDYISKNFNFELERVEPQVFKDERPHYRVKWSWKNETVKEKLLSCLNFMSLKNCIEEFRRVETKKDKITGKMISIPTYLGKNVRSSEFMYDLISFFYGGLPVESSGHVEIEKPFWTDFSKDSGYFDIYLTEGWETGETIVIGFGTTTIAFITTNNTRLNDATPNMEFRVEGDYDGYVAELFINSTGNVMTSYGTVNVLNNTDSNITTNSSLSDGIYRWYINATNSSTTSMSGIQYFILDTDNPGFLDNTTTPSDPTYVKNQNYIFNISWDEDIDNSILEFNGSNYTMTLKAIWKGNADIETGISLMTGNNAPSIYDIDNNNAPDLILGGSDGSFIGHTWDGSQWVSNNSITAGLLNVGSRSTLDIYDIDNNGAIDLIAGSSNGIFRGFTWNNSQWIQNATINASLPSTRSYVTVALGDIGGDGVIDLITGDGGGGFGAFTWNGSNWIENTTTNASLFDIGSDSAPTFYDINKDHSLDLIVGKDDGRFLAFTWDGSNWNENTSINASLPDIGANSFPSIYDIDNDKLTDMIAGNGNGYSYGYSWHPNNYYYTITDLAAGSYNWRVYANDTAGNMNMTDIWTLNISKASHAIYIELNQSSSNVTSEYGRKNNATGYLSITQETGSGRLYRNDTLVTSGSPAVDETLYGGGIYKFTYNWTGSNFTDNSTSLFLTITRKPTSMNLLLNGSDSDVSYNQTDLANFTSVLNVSTPLTINISTNITGWEEPSGISPLYNLTTLTRYGIFKITGYWYGNQNYTNSNESHFAIVTDNTPPNANFTYPASGATVKGTIEINATVEDNLNGVGVNASEVYYKFGTNPRVRMYNTTATLFNSTLDTTLYIDGIYNLELNASDLNGNSFTTSITIEIQNAVGALGGGGAGGGGGGGPIKRKDFAVGDDFNITIKKGQNKTVDLWIKNNGTTGVKVYIDPTHSIKNFIYLPKDKFTVNKGRKENIFLYISAAEEADFRSYPGKINFYSGSLYRQISVVVDVVEMELEADVVVPEEFKTVLPGEDIKANIILVSEGPRDVQLKYSILDLYDKAIVEETDETTIEGYQPLLVSMNVPEWVRPGTYRFSISVKYDGGELVSHDTFSVYTPVTKSEEKYRTTILILVLTTISIVALEEVVRRKTKKYARTYEFGKPTTFQSRKIKLEILEAKADFFIKKIKKKLRELFKKEEDRGARTYIFGESPQPES